MRTNRPAGDAVSALRNKVRAIDPASPLFEAGVLQEAVDSSFDNRRAVMLLLTAFAAAYGPALRGSRTPPMQALRTE